MNEDGYIYLSDGDIIENGDEFCEDGKWISVPIDGGGQRWQSWFIGRQFVEKIMWPFRRKKAKVKGNA